MAINLTPNQRGFQVAINEYLDSVGVRDEVSRVNTLVRQAAIFGMENHDLVKDIKARSLAEREIAPNPVKTSKQGASAASSKSKGTTSSTTTTSSSTTTGTAVRRPTKSILSDKRRFQIRERVIQAKMQEIAKKNLQSQPFAITVGGLSGASAHRAHVSHSTLSINEGKGFSNLGNTCFMNATLQDLFDSPSIDEILAKPATALSEDAENLRLDLIELQNEHAKDHPDTNIVNASLISIRNNPLVKARFALGRMQDSHEFSVFVLDALGKTAAETPASQRLSLIYKTRTDETHTVAGLTMPRHESTRQASPQSILELGGDTTSSTTVKKLLAEYATPNKMVLVTAADGSVISDNRIEFGGAKFNCSRSSSIHVDAARFTTLLLRLPRFNARGEKNQSIIVIENRLKLPVTDVDGGNKEEIDLRVKSVVCHEGATRNSGHYYTVKREKDGSWIKASDSSVTPLSESEAFALMNKNGYQVRYEKVS